MSDVTLLLSAAFQVVSALLFGYVGRRVSARRVDGDARVATVFFGVWWYSLAGLNASSAFLTTMAVAGMRDLALWVAVTYMTLLALCVALAGLVYYLLYLYTGARRLLLPVLLFYAAYYVLLIYIVTLAQPNGIKVDDWSVQLSYANADAITRGSPVVLAVLLLLLVPPLAGAVAYFSLYFRVKDPTQRYRIGLVSLTVLCWFGSSLVASIVLPSGTEGTARDVWAVASRLIGLAAAGAILMAYQPPRWIRDRYGIRAVDEPTAEAGA